MAVINAETQREVVLVIKSDGGTEEERRGSEVLAISSDARMR